MLCVGGLRTIPPRLFCVTTNWSPTILKKYYDVVNFSFKMLAFLL